MRRIPFRALAEAALSFLLLQPAKAWDGMEQGLVGQIDATSAGNYAFRVMLNPLVPMCGSGSGSWAYVDTSDGNYRAYTALVMLARAQGITVRIYTDRDGQGYCKIGYLAVYP